MIPLATNQGCKNLIVKDVNVLDYKFLAYLMRSMKDKLESMGIGGTYKEVSKSRFESIRVPLPPMSAQEELVAELDSYLKIIDGARQVIENWKPRIDIDSEWPVTCLGDLVKFNSSSRTVRRLADDTPVSFIPMSDIEIGEVYTQPVDVRLLKDVRSGYKQFFDNDILLAKITPCFENGKIGIVKGLLYGFGFGSTEFFVIKCGEQILPEIVYIYLSSSKFREYAKPFMTGSAGQKRVPEYVISDYPIPVPPIKEQELIVANLLKELQYLDVQKELIKLYQIRIDKAICKLWDKR